MRDLFILVAHLLTTIAKLLEPGGARAIIADSLLMKQQLLIINRHRKRVLYRCLIRNPHRNLSLISLYQQFPVS